MTESKESAPEVYRRHDPAAVAVLWGGVFLFPALIALLFMTRADSADTSAGFLPPFAVATALMALGLLQQRFNRLEVAGDKFTYYNWLGNKTATFTRADVQDIEFDFHRNNQSLWIVSLPGRAIQVPDAFKGVRAVMEDLIKTLPNTGPVPMPGSEAVEASSV